MWIDNGKYYCVRSMHTVIFTPAFLKHSIIDNSIDIYIVDFRYNFNNKYHCVRQTYSDIYTTGFRYKSDE
jgi:uncharacterized Fe-S radical SAM superfamily protein PflX